MTRRLRRNHRMIIQILVVIVPLGFIGSILCREVLPILNASSIGVTGTSQGMGTVTEVHSNLWSNDAIVTRIYRGGNGALSIEIDGDRRKQPDVLVYWVSVLKEPMRDLPLNARWLGSVGAENVFILPVGLKNQSGRLLLYSLAQAETLDISKEIQIGSNGLIRVNPPVAK